ncbi:SPOPL [Cordylochernes scorpioides]|uniref:SPOPL n=1 Tax=Cordylochernes scorpioides TaxID=51811 RepID=A0ABY6KWN3_9ARAC|nr:SPOPL [Cordylochernes scorpioides]
MSIKNQLSNSASKPIADTYCHTVDKMYHSSFMWTIENFTTHRADYNEELISSFCFERVAEVSILNLKNEETNKKCVEFFTDAQFHKFISNTYLNKKAWNILPEDKLTLYFKISLYVMVTSTNVYTILKLL